MYVVKACLSYPLLTTCLRYSECPSTDRLTEANSRCEYLLQCTILYCNLILTFIFDASSLFQLRLTNFRRGYDLVL